MPTSGKRSTLHDQAWQLDHSQKMGSKQMKAAVPRYEFGGPLGAFGVSFGLPVLIYAFHFGCNNISGCPVPSLLHPSTLDLESLKRETGWPGIWRLTSWKAIGWTLAYYVFNMLLYRFLPGQEVMGQKLANGGRLKYKLNAFSSHMFTLAVALAGTCVQGAQFPLWTFITDNYVQLLTASILISYALSTYVYVKSFRVKPGNPELRELAVGGVTGNMMYDWFIGRELNPRVTLPVIGELDIKVWAELRPGMLGWLLINCAFVAKQYRDFGYVTNSIFGLTLIQLLYILDSWVMEPAILTIMDITTDGFGCMLAFGDLVWVPFLYSAQVRYLAFHPVTLDKPTTLAIAVSLVAGFVIFRLANYQKHVFRTNPDDPRVSHLQYLQTKSGSRLLITGWWGMSRHINYFGDWLQSWAYCLPTGLAGYVILSAGTGSNAEGAIKRLDGAIVAPGEARGWAMVYTYFYIIYFAVLLIHRQGRDDEKCSEKYGDDWETYKKMVPYKIIPYVY